MNKNVIISYRTILLSLLTLLGFYVIFRLWSIIGLVVMALFISISLEHTVQTLIDKKIAGIPIKRPLAVFLSYGMLFSIFVLVAFVGYDPVVTQYRKLASTLSQYQDGFSIEGFELSIGELISGFVSTTGGVISATTSFISNLASLLAVLVLSVYISIDWENIKSSILNLFNDKHKNVFTTILEDIETTIGKWLGGQIVLMLVIGFSTYVTLLALNVDFPLALGIIAGILEIVPFFGPLITAAITILVAPDKALFIVIMFIVIQQLESNILVPKIMQKVSGFSPLVILLAIMVGSNLFGIMGAIIAVPALMIGSIIVKKFI